jgi:hypothetical protein
MSGLAQHLARDALIDGIVVGVQDSQAPAGGRVFGRIDFQRTDQLLDANE